MLKSIKRSFQLISKDEFDTALFKATNGDTVLPPKEKYLTILIECLKGDNKRVLALDAFTRIYDQILNINFRKWMESLKWGYILHLCIYTNCKIFVEAMCTNGIFTKVKTNQTPLQQEDFVRFLHGSIAQNYFNYLQNRYENLMYFQNATEDLEQKEENQKQLIIHKIIKTLTLILKHEKELDISFQKFPQLNLLKHIGFLLLRDLVFFYPIARDYIQQRIGTIMTQEISIAKKLYQNYTELLRMGRNVKRFMLMKHLISDAIDKNEFSILEDIEIFQVDQQKNQEIELYFSKVQPKEMAFHTKEPEIPIRNKPPKHSCTLPLHERKSEKTNTSYITSSPTKKKQDESPGELPYKNQEILEIVQFDDEAINKYEDDKETTIKLSFHGIRPSILSPTQTIDTYFDQFTPSERQDRLFFCDPEPDEIKVIKKDSPKKMPPRRQFTLKKSRELDVQVQPDNQSCMSTISQKTSGTEYSEQRVLGFNGLSKQLQGNQVLSKPELVLDMKSPLGFLSFQDQKQNKQEERKKN